MHEADGFPPEAVLLAQLARLGQVARELLARSHLTALLDEGVPQDGRRRLPSTDRTEAPRLTDPAGHVEAVARALVRLWSRRPPVSTLQRYGEAIDVTTPAGRWQLLALAVLLGAPVRRESAEETFCQLRRQDLLQPHLVAEAPPGWREAADAVMARLYRGPVNRVRQRERLTRAARVLQERWGGDLDGLYREAEKRPDQAATLLRRSFEGIDRLAAWLVREMGRLGAWPGAHRHPAAFFADPFLREAAANLGLLEAAAGGGVEPAARDFPGGHGAAGQEAGLRWVVAHHFQWDSTVLSSHGREFCHARNAAVCLSRCPVARYCRAWASWVKPDTGKEAGGRSTGS